MGHWKMKNFPFETMFWVLPARSKEDGYTIVDSEYCTVHTIHYLRLEKKTSKYILISDDVDIKAYFKGNTFRI